ncbi:MerR family transcriptional regulator [Enterococcus saigonensis]|uniref:MerR family transcriptional regulator n=1 Tax=Enterococcus saigonensis TaxID=1805431 RepID=A0A679I8K5_9ENTE|nr:MerR family transcriptional regulator [Enterococcus saigonensis]BCA85918.1 MerR family transcriptional regulator [Enterococcus saigonensis]
MNISEVSKAVGVPQETLRYYEKIAILPKIDRSKGGLRKYKQSDLEWISFVKTMRTVGTPIDSLKEYYDCCNKGNISECKAFIEFQKNELELKRNEIETALTILNEKIKIYE